MNNEEYIKKLEAENKMLIEALKQLEELQEENRQLKGFNNSQARLLAQYQNQRQEKFKAQYQQKPIFKDFVTDYNGYAKK
jgi:hypothetical protein